MLIGDTLNGGPAAWNKRHRAMRGQAALVRGQGSEWYSSRDDPCCGNRSTVQERSVTFAAPIPFLASYFLARSCQSSSMDGYRE
jgi:hypothetical protein